MLHNPLRLRHFPHKGKKKASTPALSTGEGALAQYTGCSYSSFAKRAFPSLVERG